jgi:hypothetical protein
MYPFCHYRIRPGEWICVAPPARQLMGDKINTQLYSALVSISLTTKIKYYFCQIDVYRPEIPVLSGDITLFDFCAATYGLGINGLDATLNFNVDGTDVSKSVLQQPMRYNYIGFMKQ